MSQLVRIVADASSTAETLAAVVWRRVRYVLAMLVSGSLLLHLASAAVAPPPPLAGPSLLLWSSQGLAGAALNALIVLGVLLAASAVAMLLIHPEAPHTAMFCSFLVLGYLAAAGGGGGGTIGLVLREYQEHHQVGTLYQSLALECALWAAIFMLTERALLWLHARGGLRNTHWMTRHGITLGQIQADELLALQLPAEQRSTASRRPRLAQLAEDLGALVTASAVILVVLSILLQSQEKGQTLFAAFVAGMAGALVAGKPFPRASVWPVCLAVPLAAGVGYLWVAQGGSGVVAYPGFARLPLGRALPIDVIALGIPGAILGAHTAIRMHLHYVLEQQ